VNTSMAATMRFGMGRTTIRRGAGKRRVDGKSLRLADEVRYIQQRAADHDGRVVTVGQLVLFSTETGDAWLLDPADQLAARLARDGDPQPIHIEENDTHLRDRLEGPLLHRRPRLHLLGSRYRSALNHP
jgi:acyl dehydratase